MRAVWYCPLLLLSFILLATNCEALQCYTCMGSNNEDCNRQGTKTCPSYSDACAVVVGQNSGVMKSCSYRSFCNQASSQGVRVQCCYSDNCNVSGANSLPGLNYLLLLLPLLFRCFF